jgi:hypothetical protein
VAYSRLHIQLTVIEVVEREKKWMKEVRVEGELEARSNVGRSRVR